MPNHCQNRITVVGKPETIAQMLEKYRSDKCILDAHLIIPYPEEFAKLDARREQLEVQAQEGHIPWEDVYKFKDGYTSGGYEWCISHWGTKWGMYSFSKPKVKPRSWIVECQSVWNPPTLLIQQMSKDFPSLKFTLQYWECGCQFQGKETFLGGVLLTKEQSKYRGHKGG